MKGKVIAAFAAVYLIWGSTYLGIKVGLESMPPLLMGGVRFIIAGFLLWLWCEFRREKRPNWRQTGNSVSIGLLLIVVGNGTVTWAEQNLSSGMVALLVGVQPMWMVLVLWGRGRTPRPSWRTAAGLLLGLAGVALLSMSGAGIGASSTLAAVVVVLGTIGWSIGSMQAQSVEMPVSPLRSNAVQMLAGGLALLTIGLLRGEPSHLHLAQITPASLSALAYLIVFGSIIAYSAYAWLLRHVSATAASTCAYVNPAVAVLLGTAAGEPVYAIEFLSMALIFGAVALLTKKPATRASLVLKTATQPCGGE